MASSKKKAVKKSAQSGKTTSKKSVQNKAIKKSVQAVKATAKKATPKASKKPAVKAKSKAPVKAKSKKSPAQVVKKTVAKPIMKAAPVASKVKNVDYTKAFSPLADRILVRLVAAERMTAGGLFIPDNASTVQGHLKGHVLAVGNGARSKKGFKRPLDVTVGDQIFFNEYASTKLNFQGEDLHIVRESDVLGVSK